MDEWLVQLSDPQDICRCSCASEKYRELQIVVPIPSASKRNGGLAERDRPAVTFWTLEKAIRWNVLFVAVSLLMVVSQPSVAQIKVDMNRITCEGWLGYSSEDRDFVRFWLSGYYNAAANSKILNYDRFQANSEKVAAYCKKHKSETLPTAIKSLGLF